MTNLNGMAVFSGEELDAFRSGEWDEEQIKVVREYIGIWPHCWTERETTLADLLLSAMLEIERLTPRPRKNAA